MLWWISQNLVVAALLAGVVWMICGTTRIGPAARHALWLVVLIKLLTPPLVVWPWGVPSFFTHLDSPPSAAPLLPIASDQPPAPSPRIDDGHIVPLGAAPSSEESEASPTPSRRDTSNDNVILSPIGDGVASHKLADVPAVITTTWSAWLVRTGGALWLAGAIWFAFLQVIRIVRMSLRLRGAKQPTEELAFQIAKMASLLGVPIEARVVSGLGSPCIWAVIRPRLLWPAELPSSLPQTAVQGLIVHELAHVKRRDHLIGWLELVAGCVWWWNPLFWYVRHQLRENAELACDAWVVGTLPTGRRAYAEALLAVCECVSKFSAPLPSVGATAGSRSAFERRLKMIARGQTPFRLSRGGLLTAVVLAATALPAWSQRSSVSQYEQYGVASDDSGFHFNRTEPELPEAAQRLYRQYQQSEEKAVRVAEQQAAARRQTLLRELKSLQDRYAREGLLDEAVAVRDHIRTLQPQPMSSAGGWSRTPTNLTQYRGQDGMQVVLKLVGDTQGTVWGSNPYTDDSSVAAAAVHAGVLQPGERGKVRITILNGASSYEGSTRNGVSTSSYGPWTGSFRIEVPPAEDRVQSDPGTLTEFRDRVGATLAFRVTGDTSGTVWGSGVYTDDSSLATAAVHAGILHPGETGTVLVKILPGRESYEGSTTGSVTTRSYGPWEGSFRFVDEGDAKPQAAAGSTTDLEMGDIPPNSLLSAYRGQVGETFQAIVIGSTEGSVWGTDTYTDDSSLAAAAVHAGVLKEGEQGVVRVTVLDGQPDYQGSTRHGVTSREWGNWGGSFRIEPEEKVLAPPPLSLF